MCSIVEQSLPEVLIGIGKQLGVRVKVSSAVHGQVHGRLEAGSGAELLNRLSALYDLEWFYNNGTVFVSLRSEAGTKLIPLGAVRAADLAAALDDLGVSDSRWPLRASSRGLAIASGPPDFLALVEQTYAALAQRPHDSQVRVFRGSAANAP